MADRHLLPIEDTRAHVEEPDCWCAPIVLEDDIDETGHPARTFVHRSDAEREGDA